MRRHTRWIVIAAAAAALGAGATTASAEESGPVDPGSGLEPIEDGSPAAEPAREPGMDGPRDRPAASTPKPASDPSGADYVVKEGDTLATIAEKELGSQEKWQVIARANRIDDPKKLRVGQQLEIPAKEEGPSGRM